MWTGKDVGRFKGEIALDVATHDTAALRITTIDGTAASIFRPPILLTSLQEGIHVLNGHHNSLRRVTWSGQSSVWESASRDFRHPESASRTQPLTCPGKSAAAATSSAFLTSL